MKAVFKNDDTVLFYGDSITDCGRNYEDLDNLGSGYANKVKSIYDVLFEDNNTCFYNTGISGNRIGDLLQRYDKDLLALKPDFISIFTGINDTWRRYDSNDATSAEDFDKKYRLLISKIKNDLPKSKIIIIEPFLLNSDPEKNIMWEDLTPKINVIRKLGSEFADYYLNAGEVFSKAFEEGMAHAHLAQDGVHPTNYGHSLLALEWLKTLEII